MTEIKMYQTVLAATACMAIATARVTGAETEQTAMVLDRDGHVPEPIVAVTNVTAWPNLTRLPNGDIVALIYNQASHGRKPGDVEC